MGNLKPQIRHALNNAFDDVKFDALCSDYFTRVYDAFGRGMRKDEKIGLLLDHCRRTPSGFKSLFDAVRQEYSLSGGKRDELTPLIEVLEAYIKSQLAIGTEEQRATLFAIASKATLADDELARLYKDTLPARFPAEAEAKRLWLVLEHLWNIPQQSLTDNTLPILVFVERLARHTDDLSVVQELRTWTNQIAPQMDIQAAELNEMRLRIEREVASVQQSPPYLLIEVMPNKRNRGAQNSYLVHISFWRGKKNTRYLHTDETPRALSGIPPLLDQVLTRLAVDMPDEMLDLTLEFFLPRELISCDVDQWLKEDEFLGEIKLGEDHRVVVRSLERARNPKLQLYWRQKWQLFQTHVKMFACHKIIRFCKRTTYRRRELYRELIQAKHACLGLTFRPIDHPDKGLLLSEILRAGIPIALWPRPSDDAGSYVSGIDETIEAMISKKNLSDLPSLIRAERQQAIDDNHPGNYLTLLWDDPDRLPANFHRTHNRRLQTP